MRNVCHRLRLALHQQANRQAQRLLLREQTSRPMPQRRRRLGPAGDPGGVVGTTAGRQGDTRLGDREIDKTGAAGLAK